MAIGPTVRKLLGPFERPISELYRSIFVDLTAFSDQILQWAPASSILELGCGEGAVAERLLNALPHSQYTGIDITPRVGRLFAGDSTRAIFKQQSIKDFARENLESFDLLIICDVMHHIPWNLHKEILTDAKKVLKPGGYLILKDWKRSTTLIHFLCYFADRYITGDNVQYKSENELRELIEEVFGPDRIRSTAKIQPWENNIAFLVQA